MSRSRIGVLGLARSGRSAAALALAGGSSVYASDLGDSSELRDSAEVIRGLGGEVELGGHSPARLAGCDLLVVSPGIPPTASILRDPLVGAIPRVSELEFAASHLSSSLIAVTGTNGKTTTTSLTASLLSSAGFDVVAAGNIGLPLSEVALREVLPEWVVVEASSFQLAGIRSFSPQIGLLTNLAPDHLDRYPDLEAYYADKARLFENADAESIWILNGEDPALLALASGVPGRHYHFRVRSMPPSGEVGAYLTGGDELVVRLEGGEVFLVSGSELSLLGVHNRANALAASLAALLAGAEVEAVRRGLRTFEPLRHRLEPVRELDGTLWINDSKATNISSARVALEGMDRPTILLLGGRHKGESYRELLPVLRDRVRVVIAYGEAGGEVESDLAGEVEVSRVSGSFEEVVERAAQLAQPGEAVLLSPACSSYDMFTDYEERGDLFRALVSDLTPALRVRGGGRDGG